MSRRRALGAGVGAAAVLTGTPGCALFALKPAPPPAPDPLLPLHQHALDLATAYQRTIAARPGLADRLAPLAQAHVTHAEELARVMNPAPAAAPSAGPSGAPGIPVPAGDDGTALAALREAELAAARDAASRCRQTEADRAPLLGSIAAARASHAEALR
jgi:multidrug resistance efflux pump